MGVEQTHDERSEAGASEVVEPIVDEAGRVPSRGKALWRVANPDQAPLVAPRARDQSPYAAASRSGLAPAQG